MTDQPTLFDERQVRRGDEHVFVQEAPAEPEPTPEETRNAALAKLKADGKADSLRARYARLLYKAAQGGIVFETGTEDHPGPDRRPRALTDKEAAHLLGCQNTTVIGRRNELMGGSQAPDEYTRCPVVEPAGTRRSIVHDSGQDVTTYRLIPTLFD
jgi:hypothetical protein